jgi:hypothetical protein
LACSASRDLLQAERADQSLGVPSTAGAHAVEHRGELGLGDPDPLPLEAAPERVERLHELSPAARQGLELPWGGSAFAGRHAFSICWQSPATMWRSKTEVFLFKVWMARLR